MKNQDNKTSISKADTLEEIGEFWDDHSLADYWDQTEAVEFKINAARRHRITIDPDLYNQISISSRKRGVLPETLINVWLTEKLKESEMDRSAMP
jgi:hypothetical protein